MYDFKLVNLEYNNDRNPYPMCALVKWDNYIQFIGTKLNLANNDAIFIQNEIGKTLIEAKKYSQANFLSDTNDFFYFTYNNIYDFSSGFSTKTVVGQIYFTNDVEVKNNYNSPFEFIDEVEIKQMKFIPYTKYAYFSIYNKKTEEMYYGVLDITLNKIILNTNENIDIFIPYSSNSMLAITKESAYRICLIKDSNGNCIDECSQSDNIIHDVEGNKCGMGCDAGKYLIIQEAVCSSECNNNIFVLYEHNCGLCRDLDSTHKYKLINGTECLNEIIEGSEIYNSKLNLLVCKSGYILNDNKCIPHCYERCKLYYEFSMDTLNQK